MTISTTTTTNRYTGNAATTVFPYTFRILAATDLVVTKRLATTLVESTLSYPADYSVSGVGNVTGGSITLALTPATGDLIVIERDTTRTQATSIRNNSSYFAETHENVFDKLTMLAQEDETALARTFSLPKTLDQSAYNMELPAPVAGQVLAWASNGLTNATVSNPSVVLPGEGRTTDTLSTYLANNYVHNVLDYDAKGDGVNDDGPAIRAAITAAAADGLGLKGGIVYFPAGKYMYTGTLQVPVALNQGQVTLKGASMRTTYLFPSGASTSFSGTGTSLTPSCLVFGALVPDASGTFTNQTQYCGMEDMSISGSLISSGSVRAVVITEMQNGFFRNVIIESFPNASVGLLLRGSTITGGLGTGTSAPHVRLCCFENIVVSTIGSNNLGGQALLLQNADENKFVGCVFGCTAGQTVSANSILTAQIKLGRNNSFSKCLWSGDTTSLKSGYTGMVFGPPTNEAGVANGSVIGNTVNESSVAEGFSICYWVQADSSGNTLGNVVEGYPSIYTTDWQDDVQPTNPGGFTLGGQGGNCFLSPAVGRMVLGVREGCAPTAVLLNNSTTPSVSGSNTWLASNGSATIITDFLNGADGQRLLIRFTNGNTTIRDVNNGGAGNIRNYGRQDIVGAANWVVLYQKIAGIWHQISPVRIEGGAGNISGAVLATNAIRGFSYIPSCAGTPTGVPTELPTGSVPMVFDTTGVKLWIYTGAAWKGVVVA